MARKFLPKRLPIAQPMDAAEREYMRNLTLYQRAYVSLVSSGLNEIIHGLKSEAFEDLPEEMRQDSAIRRLDGKNNFESSLTSVERYDANFEKSIRALFASVQNQLKELFPDKMLKRWAQMMVTHVNDVSKKNLSRVTAVADLEIEPLLKDNELNPYFKNIVDENVGLIRSIPEEKMSSFKNALVSAISADKPHNEIAKIIEKNFDITRNKVTFIARDQVNKLNGKLNQYRQQKIGGSRYVWRSSHDRRVRRGHGLLDGKICSWDNPPIVDKTTGRRAHPGQDFQCRCTAEMILEDVVD
jgi:SPP1 gp7 family putative phage head morphogenesis protein